MAYNKASGKVTNLYPYKTGCYIALAYTPPEGESKPLNDYFRLEKSHENYNSLYSLSVVAAVNGYNLLIKTSGNIVGSDYPKVDYMAVEIP